MVDSLVRKINLLIFIYIFILFYFILFYICIQILRWCPFCSVFVNKIKNSCLQQGSLFFLSFFSLPLPIISLPISRSHPLSVFCSFSFSIQEFNHIQFGLFCIVAFFAFSRLILPGYLFIYFSITPTIFS